MEKLNKEDRLKKSGSSRIWLGLLIVLIGIALLGQKLGLPLPQWLFTWPVLLIVIGVGIGVKDKFHNPGSWIMILIGCVFLADNNVAGLDFHRFIWPAILIIVGLVFILRPKRSPDSGRFSRRCGGPDSAGRTDGFHDDITIVQDADKGPAPETININSVFGGIKRFVMSKNFQGGTIVTFMGGAEVNLSQADILQPVVIDVSNLFGGTKLVIPPNWDLKNEVTAVFGGVEDKRNLNAMATDQNKIIRITGVCVFGGIELSSY